MKFPFTPEALYNFIKEAGLNTYAAGASNLPNPERPGFNELMYEKGDFSYRDSYTGYYRSWGSEVVRFQKEPVWVRSYGGGMVQGQEELADHTFAFLKKALSAKDEQSQSFRGPAKFSYGEWEYSYDQEGDVSQFSGYEQIKYQGNLVFTHRVIGGIVLAK